MHGNPTLALRLDDALAWCTDTAYDEENVAFVRGVDVLAHEAFHAADSTDDAGHTAAGEAARLAAEAGVGRLVLIHVNPDGGEDSDEALLSFAQPQFEATVVWMHERPMLQGRSYQMRIGPQTVMATIAPLKYKVNVDTLEHVASRTLELNDIGVCGIGLSQPIVFEPYAENRDLGGFVLVDRVKNATVGAGLLHFELRRSQNVHWQAIEISREAHAA